MHTRRRLWIAALATALIVPLSAAAKPIRHSAPPPSFPLWCRGGGQMFAQLNAENPHETVVRVQFKWAATAATQQTPPLPGECSWLDRAVRPGEPAKLEYEAQGLTMIVSSKGGGRPNVVFDGGLINPALYAIWNGVDQQVDFKVLVTTPARN